MPTDVPNITYDYGEILNRLSQFFPAEQVNCFPLAVSTKSNPPSGLAAFYIDARAVQQRLDDTCVWQLVFKEDPRSTNAILAGISILVKTENGFEWITRWDGADNSDIEATKGGLSGALRRAAVQWGIGRYLYEVEGKWYDMKPARGSGKPKYFAEQPRIAAAYLPPDAQRARKTNASTAPAASDDKPAPARSPKLTPAQTKTLQELTATRSRKKVSDVYAKIVDGELSFDEGVAAIKEIPETK